MVEPPAPKLAPVIDIMEALKSSLSERRKPVQSVNAAASETMVEPIKGAPRKRRRNKAS